MGTFNYLLVDTTHAEDTFPIKQLLRNAFVISGVLSITCGFLKSTLSLGLEVIYECTEVSIGAA